MIRTADPSELYAFFADTVRLPTAWPMTRMSKRLLEYCVVTRGDSPGALLLHEHPEAQFLVRGNVWPSGLSKPLNSFLTSAPRGQSALDFAHVGRATP